MLSYKRTIVLMQSLHTHSWDLKSPGLGQNYKVVLEERYRFRESPLSPGLGQSSWLSPCDDEPTQDDTILIIVY